MEKDFEVGQSNELVKDGRVYDLHNLYDFSGIHIGAQRCVRLSFSPNPEHGGGLRAVVIVFHRVDFLQVGGSLGATDITDLDEVGYKEPGDEDDSWLLDAVRRSPQAHLFFRLGADAFVRIHSARARLWELML